MKFSGDHRRFNCQLPSVMSELNIAVVLEDGDGDGDDVLEKVQVTKSPGRIKATARVLSLRV